VVIGGIALAVWVYASPGKYDEFAKCLTDKGAKFYGAFWCPHCQAQKKMFGRSAKHLPYVECSTPNGKGQLPLCKEKRIEGYPLWEFADGERKSGEVSLDDLSRKTSCPLPTQG
jgi:thiol-disulfide isomerase/thioredoxin